MEGTTCAAVGLLRGLAAQAAKQHRRRGDQHSKMLNLHVHLSLTAVSPVGRIANRTTLSLDGSTSKGVCPSYFRNRPNVQVGLGRILRSHDPIIDGRLSDISSLRFTFLTTFASKNGKANNVQEKSDGRSSPKQMRTPEVHLPRFRGKRILQPGLLGRRRERQLEQQLRVRSSRVYRRNCRLGKLKNLRFRVRPVAQ